jgi:hypothetical protein
MSLRRTVRNGNLIQVEMERRLNSGNACYHSVKNILSSRLLSKSVRIRIYEIIFLPVVLCGPPLWSSGQSSWLRIQRSGFDSRYYQIFWEVVGLERGPLSLMSAIEGLLGKKIVATVYKTENTTVGDLPRWLRTTPLSIKVGTNFADKRLRP